MFISPILKLDIWCLALASGSKLAGKSISVGDLFELTIVVYYLLSRSVAAFSSRVMNSLCCLSPYLNRSHSGSIINFVAAEAVCDESDIIFALLLPILAGEMPTWAWRSSFSFSISVMRSSKSWSWFLYYCSFIIFSSYRSNFPGELDCETAKSPESSSSSFLGDTYFFLLVGPFYWPISLKTLSASRF